MLTNAKAVSKDREDNNNAFKDTQFWEDCKVALHVYFMEKSMP